jgi:hypothetical protein
MKKVYDIDDYREEVAINAAVTDEKVWIKKKRFYRFFHLKFEHFVQNFESFNSCNVL